MGSECFQSSPQDTPSFLSKFKQISHCCFLRLFCEGKHFPIPTCQVFAEREDLDEQFGCFNSPFCYAVQFCCNSWDGCDKTQVASAERLLEDKHAEGLFLDVCSS